MTHGLAWRDHRLTTHWRVGELVVSREHPELLPRTPPPWRVAANLGRLAALVLEPISMRFGAGVCTSGWRPPPLNRAVGGSPTSQHPTGCAADIHVPGLEDHLQVLRFLEALDHNYQSAAGYNRQAPGPPDARLLSQTILYLDALGRGVRVHLAIHDPQQPTAGVGREWMLARRTSGGWGYEVLDRQLVADGAWTP